eukprot:CAMPEP_0203662414 /NCGR_PEP_ID=MMETSP0090-20130426/386_1 /ASSEMBLY_ACC=CAM_ASM_001088 /TAXON_ID=426623 /ORGANISM="Chaetoceros affinis, Strain CCMP159" /LENGTH=719 /DNA_ID=CAMNT_0050525195 /DNA_START=129 /DNA_END=2288 /DNA_ORIENTATION=-
MMKMMVTLTSIVIFATFTGGFQPSIPMGFKSNKMPSFVVKNSILRFKSQGNPIFSNSKDNPVEEYSGVDNDDDDDDEKAPIPVFSDDEMEFSRAELERLTVNQLKQQLRLRNMKVGGKKSELVNRLMGNYSSHAGEEMDEEAFLEPEVVGGSKAEEVIKSKAKKFAEERGKEFVDVTEFLDEDDKGKETKSSLDDKDKDDGDDEDPNKSLSPETWGNEAKIVEDYEGRSVIIDNLSRTKVQFKGSSMAEVNAYVVASRDSLKKFLAGGNRLNNTTDLSTTVKNIQMAREKASRVPMRLEDHQGEDVDDEEGHYTKILDRDYGDYGDFSMTGAQLSAQEVKGVLLLSDVYGAFGDDTKLLADKIAFECQPVVVFVPDLFRGKPWKEEGNSGCNSEGQSYEEWRACHPDDRVSVDIRAAAAALREQYGVSSVSLFGQCYGGGRALEVTARSYPNDTLDDVNGELGPPHVNPSTCIAWYPTRYDAEALFGEARKKSDDRNSVNTNVMAIFAEDDDIPGATTSDAEKLKKCLETDNRVNDHMVKIFPGQKHGFAHIGISNQNDSSKDEFLDEEFGGSTSSSMESSDAEVACLLSTAWMETYARIFLPTVGEAVKEDISWSELRMDLTNSHDRNVREEIEEALENHKDAEIDLERMHPDDFSNPFAEIDPDAMKAQPFGISLEDDADAFLDKLEKALEKDDLEFLPGLGDIPLDENEDLGKAYW